MTSDGLPQQFDRSIPIIPKAPIPSLRLIPRRSHSRSGATAPQSSSRVSDPLASIIGLLLLLLLSLPSLGQAQEDPPETAPPQAEAPQEPAAPPAQPQAPPKGPLEPQKPTEDPKVETQTLEPPLAPVDPTPKAEPATETPQPVAQKAPVSKPHISVTVASREPAVTTPVLPILPPQSSRLISLTKLSATELQEICASLELRLAAELGYERAEPTIIEALPNAPLGLTNRRDLTRSTPNGTAILRLGVRPFLSQPPQCWMQGITVTSPGTWINNADLGQVEPAINEIVKAINDMKKNLSVSDLETKLVQLSYVDASTAIAMLQGMGMSTMGKPTDIPGTVDYAKLPYIASIPDPSKEQTGLVGSSVSSGQFGVSLTPGTASDMTQYTIASPMSQLMVLFHPAHPEQFSKVRDLLDHYIDRPARQIFIEGMVLEINEEGLKDLGISWELNTSSPIAISTDGTLSANSDEDTLTVSTSDTSMLNNILEGKFEWDWSTTLRALISSSKAEVLSRPSVLTLNNRQSTIRVGKDLPIATSYEGGDDSDDVSFTFKYLPTGILLNIRPRINEAGTEVSMLIDTIVSDEVPGEDLELLSSDDQQILASAPTVSTRRVQTYGRVRNNTPFIIGGLVSREKTLTQSKVPILGDLPLIGAAFRAQKNENTKTEVIIVITPYVLPENKLIPRSLPKDEDLFDSFGHKLFRDSYRIRAEDVFDLSFLLEDPRISRYRDRARQAAKENFRLAQAEPFRSFVEDSIPGESVLVTRMIYEVVKRLDLAGAVNPKRVIYMASKQDSGYNVGFLESLLNKQGGSKSSRFKGFKDQALAFTFKIDPHTDKNHDGDAEAIPSISLVDCPDRKAWGNLLWDLNQPLPDGRQRHTILIQNESDLMRLRRAMAIKKIEGLNGGTEQMRLKNFSIGKVLLMPEFKDDQIHLLDAEAATLFFQSEHYYGATLEEIEKQIKRLDEVFGE